MNTGIDSTKIRIPLSKVDVLKYDLTDYFLEVNERTGEVQEGSMKLKAYPIEEHGIKTRYAIYKGGTSSREEDSLIILANSKLLKSDYLLGITSNTVKKLYNELMKHQIVSFSFDAFLGGNCTDTDIKRDEVLLGGLPQQIESVKTLSKLTKPSIQKRKGHDMRTQATNVGIQWSKREVATPGSPHLKLYAKDIELRHNSYLFLDTYLGGQVQEGLTRIEGTIKNKKHWNKLGYAEQEMTLGNLLNLSEEQMNQIIKDMAGKHIDQGEKYDGEKGEEWSLTDGFCYWVLQNESSLHMAKYNSQYYFKDKQQTYRARKQIEKIWNDKFEDTEKGKHGKELDKIFGAFGVGED